VASLDGTETEMKTTKHAKPVVVRGAEKEKRNGSGRMSHGHTAVRPDEFEDVAVC